VIDLKISPDGEKPFVVTAEPRDILVWERTGRDRSFDQLMSAMRMTDLYEIAYITARRLGLTTMDKPTFETACNVEPHAETEEPDPTRTAA
jgi:hypothetical protein